MEKWDAYTREGILTDIKLVRGEPIPNGLYHLVCDVLVRHEDGSYLCVKRSMSKPNYPGYYEATAGGAAFAGEDKIQCIKRELEEETGIVCEVFEEIAVHICDENHCIYHCFVCCVNCDKDTVKLQPGETEDYKWMTEAEFIEFANSEEMIEPQKRRYLEYFEMKKYIV